jgi:hypothetical protein
MMAKPAAILECSLQIYEALLSLYPDRFRARFGAEMLQIFGDCLRTEQGAGFVSLWMRTLADLARSLSREWRNEFVMADGELDYTGIADAFMITIVAGTNLLGWGAAGSALAVGVTGLFEYSQSAANVLLGLMTLPMAAFIGIVSALIVARVSRVECNRITG